MAINTKYSAVPIQKLPLSKKGKKWREKCIDAFIGKSFSSNVRGKSEAEDLKIKYDLYNGKFDIRDIEYVVDPFRVGDSLPASPQNFNIIRPKIDLLIGEESKRPENIKVVQIGDLGASKAEETQLDLLMQYVMSRISGQPQQGQQQTPEQIQKYMQFEYSDIAEKTGYYAIQYLREKLNTRNEFLKGWKDALIAGKEIYYVGTINGEPSMERVNPIGFYYDKSPDVEFIEDGDWAVRHMLMTPASIHDRFYDQLSNSDLNRLIELSGGGSRSFTGKASDVNYDKVLYKEPMGFSDTYTDGGESGSYLDVYHVTWKSMKKLGFLSYVDENGDTAETTVDETYKPGEDEDINWMWVVEIWEGYKIGDDIYVGIEPLSEQEFSLEHPNDGHLPYIGAIYSDDNSTYTSLIDVMRPLQYMYIIIWFRLEVALARDKGRVLTMDVTQIPKSMGIDVSKWMHYLSTLGVNLINPYEEGWDIPGRVGGQPASFNQISSVDLSMSKVIADYIQLMTKLEDMMGELTGVSRQRQGAISSNELVGNVERSVIQSSHITEPLYWKHNQVKKRGYTALLNVARSAWSDSTQKKLHFIMDDTSRAFIDLNDDFLYSDLGVFMSDSSKEDRDLQALKNLSQAAVQGGASLSEIAEMISLDNVTMVKNKLAEIDARRQQLEQQQAQKQQEVQMAQIQAQQEMKAEENRIKEEDSIRKAQTQIEVALIGANANTEGGKDYGKLSLEQEKLSLQKQKQESDQALAKEKINEEQRKNRVQENIKRNELEIKRKQANKPNKTTK